ncbi:recombinase family protein [Chloroflexota bacterium]
MRSCVYLRVSSDSQESEGTSLTSQRQACLDRAVTEGYQVPEDLIFIETYSGLTLDRPEITKLRDALKGGSIDAVIAYTPDRLCRNGEDILTLAKEFKLCGAKLLFVKEQWEDTLNGKLIAFILGWASEFEAAQIKERSQRGKIARAKEGKLPGGCASKLFGYDFHDGVRHVNKDTAQVVKDIYRWFVGDNLSLAQMAIRLTSFGILTPSGNHHWSKAVLSKMLSNRAYIGETIFKFKFTGEEINIPNATPAIIDPFTFEQAQLKLKRNRELSRRNAKREYLLRGYLKCSVCGRSYSCSTRTSYRNGRARFQETYRCSRQCEPTPAIHCSNHIWNVKRLDRLIWEQVENILTKPETVLSGIMAMENYKKRVKQLEAELSQVDKHLDSLTKEQEQLLSWALKGFPEETIVKENERINRTREELKQHKVRLEGQIKSSRQAEINTHNIKEACATVQRNLEDLTLENRRLAMEALDMVVYLNGEDVRIEGSIPIGGRATSTTRSPRRLSRGHRLSP